MTRTCHAWILLAGLILSISGGCMEQSRYRRVQGNLDKALYYYEVDRYDANHAISSELVRESDPCCSRVPAPAIVDIDSQIQVRVAKDRLIPRTDSILPTEHSEQLLGRKYKMQKALGHLAKYVEARNIAVQAYHEGGPTTFARAEEKYDAATLDLLGSIMELWPREAPERPILEDIFLRRKRDPTLSRLHDFLQTQIDAIDANDQALVEDVQQSVRSLRLEAQVVSDGADPLFIHLEGYDTLEQGQLQARDRWGVNLSPEETERLKKQVEATQKVAEAAEAVRKEEITVQEAIARAAPYVSRDLAACIQDIQRLKKKYDEEAVEKKLREIRDLLEKLVAQGTACPRSCRKSSTAYLRDSVHGSKRIVSTP